VPLSRLLDEYLFQENKPFPVRIKRSPLSKGHAGGTGLVFDRFKSWSNSNQKGVVCPSCQHSNQEGTEVCTRCYYQIDRPSFQQSSGLGDDESTDLLDQLMSEIEEDEEENEPIAPSFAFDDLTVEVSQYGEDDEIKMDRKPDFDPFSSPSEEIDEEYELTADDIPQFVQKFEVPSSPVEEEREEPLDYRTIELIQPNAETPSFSQPMNPSETIEADEIGTPPREVEGIGNEDFDGDGKIDEFEEAFAKAPSVSHAQPIPPAPSIPVPRLNAVPIHEEKEPEVVEMPVQLPSAPVLSPIEGQPAEPHYPAEPSFWPWQQQDEWPVPEIIKQLQAAFRSAKEQNKAQTTVLLDEVGPHLGNRTSLIYSVGKLLMSIGRNSEAQRMVELAHEKNPEDQDVVRAKEKLAS